MPFPFRKPILQRAETSERQPADPEAAFPLANAGEKPASGSSMTSLPAPPEEDAKFVFGKTEAIALALYLAFTGCICVYQFFYFTTEKHPVPRRFINSSQAKWEAFRAFMFIFGAALSFINSYLWGAIALIALANACAKPRIAYTWVLALAAAVVAAGMVVFPTFASVILEKPVLSHEFDTACNSLSPVQAILFGERKAPEYLPIRAMVSTTASQGSRPLFTYEMKFNNSLATFKLSQFDSDESSLSPEMVPEIRTVQYDFANQTITGNCSSSTGEDRTNCLSGTFTLEPFTVDLTFDSSRTGSVQLRTRNTEPSWLMWEGEPGVILQSVATNGEPQGRLLQTALKYPTDRTRMKVCLTGTNEVGAGPSSGADVIASLGLLLNGQVDYSRKCIRRGKGRKCS